ncbi:MAG: oxidoreductase [Gammaproteobacteria bacterium]
MSSIEQSLDGDFFVVAREAGAEHPALPTWANRCPNPAGLAEARETAVERGDIEVVPGAFHLLNIFDARECDALIALTEACGYLPDAAVSLPRSIRHNDNLTWVVDEVTADIVWRRCALAVNQTPALFQGRRAVGLNARFRFYRYGPGDYFAPHTDGAWPGSQVVGDELVTDAFGDRWSQLSFVAFLSDDYAGGSTHFYVSAADPARPARGGEAAIEVSVRTPLGAALCFPHGLHPLHCLHSSEPIRRGTKYIIRTDVLVENG